MNETIFGYLSRIGLDLDYPGLIKNNAIFKRLGPRIKYVQSSQSYKLSFAGPDWSYLYTLSFSNLWDLNSKVKKLIIDSLSDDIKGVMISDADDASGRCKKKKKNVDLTFDSAWLAYSDITGGEVGVSGAGGSDKGEFDFYLSIISTFFSINFTIIQKAIKGSSKTIYLNPLKGPILSLLGLKQEGKGHVKY